MTFKVDTKHIEHGFASLEYEDKIKDKTPYIFKVYFNTGYYTGYRIEINGLVVINTLFDYPFVDMGSDLKLHFKDKKEARVYFDHILENVVLEHLKKEYEIHLTVGDLITMGGQK